MIKWIVIAIIGLILLGYMGFDIRKTVESSAVHNNLEYGKELVVVAWNKYLKGPVVFIWEEVIDPYIITPIKNLLKDEIKKKVSARVEIRGPKDLFISPYVLS